MGRYAYAVTKIEWDSKGGFSWHHPAWDWLADCGYLNGLNEDSCGMVEIPVSVLEELGDYKFRQDEGITMTRQEAAQLRYDAKQARKRGDEYIRYYCF